MDEWIKKCVYIHNGVLSSHKKEWSLAFCDDIDGPQQHNPKWNNSDRKINTVWSLLYVES